MWGDVNLGLVFGMIVLFIWVNVLDRKVGKLEKWRDSSESET